VMMVVPLCLAALASDTPLNYENSWVQVFAISALVGLFAVTLGIRRLSFWALAGSPGEAALVALLHEERKARLAGRAP